MKMNVLWKVLSDNFVNGLHNRQPESIIGRIVEKFQEFGILQDQISDKYSRRGK